MSDGITTSQQAKIITGLFRVSYPYLCQAVHFTPKLKDKGHIPPILPWAMPQTFEIGFDVPIHFAVGCRLIL